MRKIVFGFAAMSAAMCFGGKAHAQWAVLDAANLANTAKTVITGAKQLTAATSQLSTLNTTYSMLTHPTDVMGMVPDLSKSFLQNSMPAASSMGGQFSGASTSGYATTMYNNNDIDMTGADPEAAALKKQLQTSANAQGMAAANLGSLEQHLTLLDELKKELTDATDIKQVEAINGRIMIESTEIEAQQAQATNLVAMTTAQAEVDHANEEQRIRQENQLTATAYLMATP